MAGTKMSTTTRIVVAGATGVALLFTGMIGGAVAVVSASSHSASIDARTASDRSSTPSAEPTATTPARPLVSTATTTVESAIPYTSSTVDDPASPVGSNHVVTAGVAGVLATTYELTLTDGVETGRRETSHVVRTLPVSEVVAVGSYVAPAPPPPPARSTTATSSGAAGSSAPSQGAGTVNPGGFCGSQGAVGVAANGRTYVCGGKGPDANGKLHWNTTG